MATTKQQKLLQLKKKNSSIFAFFKKIQLFMSVERKTILDVVAIKHRKQFLKIDLKNLNFRAKRNSKQKIFYHF